MHNSSYEYYFVNRILFHFSSQIFSYCQIWQTVQNVHYVIYYLYNYTKDAYEILHVGSIPLSNKISIKNYCYAKQSNELKVLQNVWNHITI